MTTSDFAIDDISVNPGPCGAPASCDFENGPCLWTNRLNNDDFDWQIKKGTSLINSKPITDHTLQTKLGEFS